MRCVVDTHALLWWFGDEGKLSRKQKRVLRSATAESPVLISCISLWEIATLHSLRRIHVEMPLVQWLKQITHTPEIQLCSISPEVAAEVAYLPNTFHRDPGDRIIVSTARVAQARLLTSDRRIVDAQLVETIN